MTTNVRSTCTYTMQNDPGFVYVELQLSPASASGPTSAVLRLAAHTDDDPARELLDGLAQGIEEAAHALGAGVSGIDCHDRMLEEARQIAGDAA